MCFGVKTRAMSIQIMQKFLGSSSARRKYLFDYYCIPVKTVSKRKKNEIVYGEETLTTHGYFIRWLICTQWAHMKITVMTFLSASEFLSMKSIILRINFHVYTRVRARYSEEPCNTRTSHACETINLLVILVMISSLQAIILLLMCRWQKIVFKLKNVFFKV